MNENELCEAIMKYVYEATETDHNSIYKIIKQEEKERNERKQLIII